MYEVKVFDGKGKLKEIVIPVINYDECASLGTSTNKVCKECGKTSKMKGAQKFCSNGNCATKNRARITKAYRERKKAELLAKPTLYCQICAKAMKPIKLKFCSKPCENKNRRNEEMAKAEVIRTLKRERNIKRAPAEGGI